MISDAQIEEALADCAAEPVHIPGRIQPAGALLAYDRKTSLVTHISENLPVLFQKTRNELLGAPARELLGQEIWHNLTNAAALPDFALRREYAGSMALSSGMHDIHAFASGGWVVAEIEPSPTAPLMAPEVMSGVNQLVAMIAKTDDETSLLETTAQLLRTVSGYDRVMIYRFDSDYNGEVVAESRKSRLEPFLGLRFPHWDIPAQAREIMRKLPLRFIIDADQESVPILTADAKAPPLDITLANLRGVSPVHMQYLRNMDTAATMTLSLLVDGRLWGIVSFHHTRPRIPNNHVRLVCLSFLPVLQTRLAMLTAKSELLIADSIDRQSGEIATRLDQALSLNNDIGTFAPDIMEPFGAQGLVIAADKEYFSFGKLPPPDLQAKILEDARNEDGKILAANNLAERYGKQTNGLAGVLALALPDDQAFMVFRESRNSYIRWAGAPEKTVEFADGMARLTPRGSFATYIEEIRGRSEPWLQRDIVLISKLGRTIGLSTQKRALIQANIRQQALMIDELNHRVRNILALIRSVSRQARRHQASLYSYSVALEKRINALAAAHDIGAGRAVDAVSIKALIRLEAAPYIEENPERIRIEGEDRSIKADLAPIFALVVHELMTNANKYGSLKSGNGLIDVKLSEKDGGLAFHWKESGGPAVSPPAARGFGSTLIEQALPHEFGGKSSVNFNPHGVEAEIWLPENVLDRGEIKNLPDPHYMDENAPVPRGRNLPDGLILIVEDNYMIASDMRETMVKLGFEDTEIASNIDDAGDIIRKDKPIAAILDINLGAGREDSTSLGELLLCQKVPFLFVTGYGERLRLPPELSHVQILTKPVSTRDLEAALDGLLG